MGRQNLVVIYVRVHCLCFPVGALWVLILHLSLNPFWVYFLYDVVKCSHFILLHVMVQFFQHHLLNRLSFFHVIFFSFFVKDEVSIAMWVYLWAFYLVPFVYISLCVCVCVCVTVPYFLYDCSFVIKAETKKADSSSSILLSQDWFGYLRSFVFPYKLWGFFLVPWKIPLVVW